MRALVPFTAWLLLMCWPCGAHSAASEEQVRAAFVASFGSYVEWPSSVFVDAHSPFVIGVAGDPTLLQILERGFATRRIQGRHVEVRKIDTAQQAGQVQVLYCNQVQLLQQLGSLPVLTVGTVGGYIERGGMIRLLMQEQRLRFEFNGKAAERAGLKVSAKLQQLALNAYEEGR